MKFNLSRLISPMGELLVVTDELDRLRALNCSGSEGLLRTSLREHYGSYELFPGVAPAVMAKALRGYFEGDPVALDAVPTLLPGDEFQRQVWTALRDIPYGQTTSYGALARTLGHSDPRMAVAVGAANAANPIAIVVPCHRVIAKNGDLRGYAWGLARKRWLLEHEGALPATPPASAPVAVRLPGI